MPSLKRIAFATLSMLTIGVSAGAGFARDDYDCPPEAWGAFVVYNAAVPCFVGTIDINCDTIGVGACCWNSRLLILRWSNQLNDWVKAQDKGEMKLKVCDSGGYAYQFNSDPVGRNAKYRVFFYVYDCHNNQIGYYENIFNTY